MKIFKLKKNEWKNSNKNFSNNKKQKVNKKNFQKYK